MLDPRGPDDDASQAGVSIQGKAAQEVTDTKSTI